MYVEVVFRLPVLNSTGDGGQIQGDPLRHNTNNETKSTGFDVGAFCFMQHFPPIASVRQILPNRAVDSQHDESIETSIF